MEALDVFLARASRLILAKCNAHRLIEYKIKKYHQIESHNQSSTFSMINYYHQWWLTNAIKLNHRELVTLLLAERTCSCWLNEPVHASFMKPLFIAVETGDIEVIWSLLRNGASATLPCAEHCDYEFHRSEYNSNVRDESDEIETFYERISAVEYACFVNRPDILKFLVADFVARYEPRYHSDLDFDTDFDQLSNSGEGLNTEEWHSTPLHSIIRLGSKIHGKKLAALPAYVQLVIDAGGNHCVHCIDACGLTPLQLLMKNVQRMVPIDEEVATEHRRIIVEITEILLKAGSKVNTPAVFKDKNSEPLSLLLRGLICTYGSIDIEQVEITALEEVHAIRNNVRLVEELTKLLLVHGADPLRDQYDIKTMAAAYYTITQEVKMPTSPTSDVFGEIKDSLANIFQYIMLAGGTNCFNDKNFMNSSYSKSMGGDCPSNFLFGKLFSALVAFSSHPDCNDRLINIMLSALSGSNVLKLKSFLLDTRARITLSEMLKSDRDSLLKSLNIAIKLVESVEVPRKLEFIACRAINRAMSKRSLLLLDSKSGRDLGLPVPRQLVPHILLQTTEGHGE